jgi:predicted CXXCH cytochrome family protein
MPAANSHPHRILVASLGVVGLCLWAGCSKPAPEADVDSANPDPYVGAAACAECHKELHDRQAQSSHAHTLRPATLEWANTQKPPAKPLRDPETGLEYSVAVRDQKLFQTAAQNGKEVSAAPFEFLVGSGHHGVSPLTHTGGAWRYLRLTHYAEPGWDLSPMHGLDANSESSKSVDGWPLDSESLNQCLRCHATRIEVTDGSINTARSELGVRCETCHGPGRAHVESVRAGRGPQAIQNPGKWSAADFMALCQQCHNGNSTMEGTMQGIPDDPASPILVMNHVYGTTHSRCFVESKGALRCTTCHDPHTQAPQNALWYEQRCLSCHTRGEAGKQSCPVNPTSGCLPCHMPKVQAAPHTKFADHWIRAKSPHVK